MDIPIQLLHPDCMPTKAHTDDAAYDLCAAEPSIVLPGKSAIIPAGFALELPVGYEALVSPRSGLAAKYGISILNSPGIIDAGYRGEVKVILFNNSNAIFTMSLGDRIAQMRIKEVLITKLVPTATLSSTQRGLGGLGSTGVGTNSCSQIQPTS